MTSNETSVEPNADLLDSLTAERTRECKAGTVLRVMGEENAAAVRAAFDSGINANHIVNTLIRKQLAGPELQRITMQKHLDGRCSCPK